MKYINLIAVLLTGSLNYSVMAEEEEGENGSLQIECKPALLPASVYKKMYEQESMPGDELMAARKRTKLGIGEKAALTLEGKDLGKADEISWEITKGSGGQLNMKKGNDVMITIKKDLKKDEDITVKATTENGRSTTISLNILTPKNITGKHARKFPDSKTDKTRGVPADDYPQDGDTLVAGASAKIDMTVQPVEVNFRNIKLKEFDGGSSGEWANTHTPHPNFEQLDNSNSMKDYIGRKYDDPASKVLEILKKRPSDKLPIKSHWTCIWMTDSDHQVGKVKQEFETNLTSDRQAVSVSVSKFTCTTQRDTSKDNVHSFTGGN